ncbi:MAG: hypothetical protein IT462_02365 [Planctomycetes bacterium]|nr:hypothetical protein [Planctomycetota bacterium]
MRFLLLIAVLCAPVLCAQDAAPAKPPAEKETLLQRTVFRFGGSFATSYGALIPTPGQTQTVIPEEGFVGEFSLMLKIEPPVKGLSGSFRACFSCHAFEVETATVQYRPSSEICVRAGRFNLPLGGINDRHDPGVRKTVSMPLTRTMGNMVRQREFNLGVLPAPAVDTGIDVSGSIDLFGAGFSFSYDVFCVTGLRGEGADISFVSSRSPLDNNGEPAAGARVGLDSAYFSVSGSFMFGHQDEARRLSYSVASLDFQLRIGRLSVEGEVAARHTQFLNAGGHAQTWRKYGYYLQADLDIWEEFYLVFAVDGLYVADVFLGPSGPVKTRAPDTTDDRNALFRAVAGVMWSPWSSLRLKLDFEYWNFSDFNDAYVVQAGVGWAF